MTQIDQRKICSVSADLANFLNAHLTEDQLNSFVKTATDLSLLQTALEVKWHLISQGRQSPINFSINNILRHLSTENTDEVCKILRFALMVQDDHVQYGILFRYIHKNLDTTNDNCKLTTLKLFHLVVTLNDSKSYQNTFKDFVTQHDFATAIINLLTVDSKDISNFVQVYILPEFLKYDLPDRLGLLKAIWNICLGTINLDILCALPEFFLPLDTSAACIYSLVHLDEFWFFLQKCLTTSNSSIQKQAVFLLKSGIYSIQNEESFTSKIVFWNALSKSQTLAGLENLAMLLEISREKQLHLIEPSYHLLPTLQVLHPTWLVCIYKILLAHSHSAVSAYAAVGVLCSSWCKERDVFTTVVQCLLPAVNKIELADHRKLWQQFSAFASELENENVSILLEESMKVSWVPSVCYQFYKCLLCGITSQKIYTSLSFTVIQNILDKIGKLPHVFIRNGCIRLIKDFRKKMFFHKGNFSTNEYFYISQIANEDKQLVSAKLQDIGHKSFILNIEHIVSTWPSLNIADLKQIKAVIKIMELPVFGDDWLEKHIFQPFRVRKFDVKILDQLCLLLYSRQLHKDVLINYTIDRLINFRDGDYDDVLAGMVQILTTNKDVDADNLIVHCLDILKNPKHCSNIIAFDIINILIKENRNKHYLFSKDIKDVVQIWKLHFLSQNKSSPQICISYLKLLGATNFEVPDLRDFLEKLLETQDYCVVPEIFNRLKHLLIVCDDLKVLLSFINLCLEKLTELKRTEWFKLATENLIQSIFSNLKVHSDDDVRIVLQITLELLNLANSCDDVAYALSKHLNDLLNCNHIMVIRFAPVIVKLLLFGDVLKRDQRAEYVVCQQIGNSNDECNPNIRRLAIRAHTVDAVQNILNNSILSDPEKIALVDEMTLLLINRYCTHFNKRYFAHSYIHLQKLRTLQALLIIHPRVSKQKRPLINFLLDSLCTESHQVSVKTLIQWLLIRLLRDDEDCLCTVTSKMNSASKVHSSTIIAFVPVLYHLTLQKRSEEFWACVFETMLPWTMGAHFNLRLYAQEGIKRLYDLANKNGFTKVCKTFRSCAKSVTEVLEQTERRIDPVDAYIFDVFNSEEDYSLTTIYFTFPKLTRMGCEEYENYVHVLQLDASKDDNEIMDMNSKQSVDKLLMETNVIQKKMSPWSKPNTNASRKAGELIVVASLIDKAPNLGGLSRTCEVFAVKQLVLSTLNVAKDHEFQSVSMSSEKWVNIAEVKIDSLRLFLMDQKALGYSIVGAEQTSNSTKLDQFKFPKKCLLLLGNEKEGIPPNMLSLMDFCVEIPQFGVVRSLNVHVAAATFIWEYRKQHQVL